LSLERDASRASEGISVPMFEERGGVGVQKAGEPPNCVGGAVDPMAVVPARHLALIFSALHVWGYTRDGFVVVAVAEATMTVGGTVSGFVVGLEVEAFIAECCLG